MITPAAVAAGAEPTFPAAAPAKTPLLPPPTPSPDSDGDGATARRVAVKRPRTQAAGEPSSGACPGVWRPCPPQEASAEACPKAHARVLRHPCKTPWRSTRVVD